MAHLCPTCRREIYSRNVICCGYCGAKLPGNLFSEDYRGPTDGPTTGVPASFQSFWDRLDALKKMDSDQKVFGASKHHYRSIRVSEAEMVEFEAWCAVTLPSSYRDYMLHIGYGAGPHYGLKSPAEIRSTIEGSLEWQPELRKTVCLSRPFPYSIADAQSIQARQDAGEKETWITSTWPIDGCIPICYHGCTSWTVLVVAGASTGRLWHVNEDGGLWLPSKRPSAYVRGTAGTVPRISSLPRLYCPPTFEEWMLGWIEQATANLSLEQQ